MFYLIEINASTKFLSIIFSDTKIGYEISITTKESDPGKTNLKSGEEKENILPTSLPSASSPSTIKRNVTFNIYEELHGEDGNELKLIEDKGNKSLSILGLGIREL